MVIAKYSPDLLPAALGAVTGHFILDYIPHRDMIGGEHLNWGNVFLRSVDLAITVGLFIWLIPPSQWLYAGLISFFAILPDLIEIPGLVWQGWRKLPVISRFHHWHTATLQYSWPKVNWFIGLLPQFILVGACIYYLK